MPFDRPAAPPALEAVIHEGRYEIAPDLAERILTERVYDRQRPVERFHVTLWADMLRRGQFGGGRQIWFGLLNGRLHLVDGQHRLHAVVAAGIAAEFQVSVFPVTSEDELRELYISFDRVGRPRTVAEVIGAMNLHTEHGLSKQVATSLYRAAILLEFRFNPPHHTADPIGVRSDNERLRYAAPYWQTAAVYEAAIKSAPASVRQRLRSPQVLAVGVATLKHQPELARIFWKTLADNDGLRRGDPRHTLLLALGERTFERVGNTGSRLAALAWNAYFEHRQINSIKAASGSVVRIAGTPFNGRA